MKAELISLVKSEIEKLGSASAVARKCKISDTAMSQYLNGKYGADVEQLENTIRAALNYTAPSSWNIAMTRDMQIVHNTLAMSKAESMFVGISEKAGAGKSTGINSYMVGKPNVYLIRCREWTGRMFLDEVMRVLGIDIPKGYVTIDTKISMLCKYFTDRSAKKCQLLIDEADKLRPTALRILIPLYNECEDVLSVVISGTENLKKEIKRGVDYSRKGYDEIDSRFGRFYHSMNGADIADVKLICHANGLTDAEKIQTVWSNCPKVRKQIQGKDINMVVDMRLLKRLIQTQKF
ncbi:MAG: ATP-binding protein [Bacteroidia bacterium]